MSTLNFSKLKAERGAVVQCLKRPVLHGQHAAVSAVSGNDEGLLMLLDAIRLKDLSAAADEKEMKAVVVSEVKQAVDAMAWPQQQTVVVAAPQGRLVLYDVNPQTFQLTRELDEKVWTHPVSQLVQCPSSAAELVSDGFENELCHIDLASFRLCKQRVPLGSTLQSVRWPSADRVTCILQSGEFHSYDLDRMPPNQAPALSFGLQLPPGCYAHDHGPDGHSVFVGGADSKICLYDLRRPAAPTAVIANSGVGTITHLDCYRDNMILVSGSEAVAAWRLDGSELFIDPPPLKRSSVMTPLHADSVVTVTHDGVVAVHFVKEPTQMS